jgi:hypothetical protein
VSFAALLCISLPAPDEPASATYSNSVVHATIPYHAAHDGAGVLTVEILDPQDEALVSVRRRIEVSGSASGAWREDLRLSASLPLEDLIWQRLHYRFVYANEKEPAIEGTDSISEILRRPVLRILGQHTYLTGGQASVRMIVADSKNEPLSGTARVALEAQGQPERVLFSGALNGRGTAEPQFAFPAGLTGSYQLHYSVETPIGSTETTQAVVLQDTEIGRAHV